MLCPSARSMNVWFMIMPNMFALQRCLECGSGQSLLVRPGNHFAVRHPSLLTGLWPEIISDWMAYWMAYWAWTLDSSFLNCSFAYCVLYQCAFTGTHLHLWKRCCSDILSRKQLLLDWRHPERMDFFIGSKQSICVKETIWSVSLRILGCQLQYQV
jgi:hypothetical protein